MHLAPNQLREEMSHTLEHNMVTLPFAVAPSSVAIQRGARLPLGLPADEEDLEIRILLICFP